MADRRGTTPPKRTLKQRAVAILARRECARAELAVRLLATGAARAEVDALLDELQHLGYLSDARYASAVVRQKSGQLARRAIVRSLRERGVSTEVAAAAIAEAGAADELAEARSLWQRRFGVPPADQRAKARQVRFLLSRGYSLTVALKVTGGAEGVDSGA